MMGSEMMRKIERSLLAFCVVATLLPRVASAQDGTAAPEDTQSDASADEAPDQEIAAAAAPDEASAEAPEETNPELEEAVERFRRGLTLARAGNCVGALAELEASRALVERPNTLYNIARCQEELFRYDLAVQAYERYLVIADADAPDRAAVESTMRQLRNLLGTIVVASNVEAAVWIGDRQVGVAPGEVLVPGGRHSLELRAEGYLPARREVEVVSRRRAEGDITLESAEVNITNQNITNENVTNTNVNVTEDGGAPVGVFAAAAVATGVSVIVAAGFSFRVLSLRSDGDELPATDLAGRTAQNERIANKATLADVFWGVSAGLAVTTTVLAFLTDWDGDEHEEGTTTERTVSVRPVAAPSSAGLSVAGTF